jgi:hypothetical protein
MHLSHDLALFQVRCHLDRHGVGVGEEAGVLIEAQQAHAQAAALLDIFGNPSRLLRLRRK